jgi:homoserine kinase
MELFLDITAEPAHTFSIEATGRNADLVGSLNGNLTLDTYVDLAPAAPALHLTIHNEIPLGMGCGSSAAALLAGVFLANHFGALELTAEQVLEEACVREGHPDNVAACFYGGLTISLMRERRVTTAVFRADLPWRLVLVLPKSSLATSEARALLPASYSRADVVENIQSTALLIAAFAQNRPELLAEATRDRIHQPYRGEACPLLGRLTPLAGQLGIFSATLSGAGPSVLLLTSEGLSADLLCQRISSAVQSAEIEIVMTKVCSSPIETMIPIA